VTVSNPGYALFGMGHVPTVLITLPGFTASWLGHRVPETSWLRRAVPAMIRVNLGLIELSVWWPRLALANTKERSYD
jgi:hypothetical protein